MENIQRKSQYEPTENIFDLTIINQSFRRLITHSEIDVTSDQSSDFLVTIFEIFGTRASKSIWENLFSVPF